MSVTIRNLLARELPLLHRILAPREEVEVSDDEARDYTGHPHLDGPPPLVPTPPISAAGETPAKTRKAKEATK